MPILKGKLIKKDDKKIINQLEVHSYPWLSFQEKNLVFPDNPRNNVILKKYHDPKELCDKVKNADQFSKNLEKKSVPLYPVDLTKDYEEEIEERIKRQRRRVMGEEEAMALELSEIDAVNPTKFYKYKSKNKVSENANATVAQATPMPNNNNEKSYSMVTASMTEIHEEEVSLQTKIKAQEEFKPTVEDTVFATNEVQKTVEEVAPFDSSTHLNEPEKPNTMPVHEINTEEIIKSAQEKGYLEGFKNGEEVAIKTQETKYENVFKNITQVVHEIEKLKDSLYGELKDAFIEIVKICSEKILREQIKFSDNALFSLFDEVIKTISEKSSIKIELNTDDLSRMKNHIQKLGIENRVTLKENHEKLSGDFTIESDRGISIVDLSKTVENLVTKLKTEIFSDDAPAPAEAVG